MKFDPMNEKDFDSMLESTMSELPPEDIVAEVTPWKKLQSHSHQDSMVLAQRQTYRSMEQNRKPRDKSTHIWTPYL